MNKRDERLDFIKTIAIIFVVCIHTIAPYLYKYEIGSFNWLLISFYRAIVSPAVPLFFMCSGALLFNKNKDISIKQILQKYIPRILIALFFWASIYEFIQIIYRYKIVGIIEKASIITAIKNMIYFKHNYQLYFIYIMLLFYIFTPFIKIFTKNATKNEIRFYLLVWIILGILLPTFVYLTPISNFYNFTQYIVMSMGYSSMGYGLLGYYISNLKNSDIDKNKNLYIISIFIGIFLSFFMNWILCYMSNDINITFLGGMSITVMLIAYGLFGLVYTTNLKIYSNKFIKKISQASFTIFLVHDIFLKLFYFMNITFSSNTILNIALTSIITLTLSYILCSIIKKIKIANKYLI